MSGPTETLWRHNHYFLGARHRRNERRMWLVVGLAAVTMVAEIFGGMVSGSMALVADGWHAATHAFALTVSALTYALARKHVHDPKFAFGSGKFGDLAAFANALVLAMVAVIIGYDSFERLLRPVTIAYDEALWIAGAGFGVNLISALLLGGGHEHGDAGHDHGPGRTHDLNLRTAYVHVLSDAATSVLAIAGLLVARAFGWRFLDPLVGMVGAAVILTWAVTLIRAAGAILVDATPSGDLYQAVRDALSGPGDEVADLHLWRIGPGHHAVIAVMMSDSLRSPDIYHARLHALRSISHATIEVRTRNL